MEELIKTKEGIIKSLKHDIEDIENQIIELKNVLNSNRIE
jgi:hypothetical protein